ncbi:MAG: MlaD family protein [Deltaproteobacteria bacterium]|nr:MlaD family protein [Deltaproteobacteria bacterium]
MKGVISGFKVGIFVILISLGAWVAFHAVTEGLGSADGYEVYALFDDATGLVDKSMVQIAGLRVGQIVDKKLEVRKARIDLFIEKDVVLYENAAISKKSTSIMGGFYLEVDPGTKTMIDLETGKKRKSKVIPPGGRIKNVFEPTTTGDIINKTGELLPEIKKLVSEVRKLATHSIKKLVNNTDGAILKNSEALHTLIKRIDSVTKDIKLVTASAPRDVGAILNDTKSTIRNLKGIVSKTGGKLDSMGSSAQKSLDRIYELIDKLDRTLNGGKGGKTETAEGNNSIINNTLKITEDLKGITGKINRGEGSVGRFITNSTIANDLENITGDVKTFTGGLTRMETIVGLRTEYNLIANTVKTYMSLSLYPRQDKFYLIELIDDPRGLRSTTYTVTRTDNPEMGPPLYRQEQISVSDSFRFTFMFGKKIDFLTFRFGIKESTGGAGADIHLLDDKFMIHADVFDFSANIFPRFKIGLMWEFYRRMFIIAGIDDLMNERPKTGAGGGRDFYIGAQVRFTDEDLKTLLMIGGSAISGLGGGGSK